MSCVDKHLSILATDPILFFPILHHQKELVPVFHVVAS
jgi:hypothetical protein